VLLFGYVLARPVSNNQVLVPVLAAMGALAVGTILVTRRRLAGPLVPVAVATFLFAALGSSFGSSNPGFWSGVLVFAMAPLLYWLASVAADERMIRALLWTAAVVTVFIGFTIAAYAAQNTGSLPSILPSWLLDQTGAGFGAQEGGGETSYTEVRFYGLSTLVATGPMWIASLFTHRDALLPPIWLRALAAVAAAAGTLAGGRRALALVLILTPVLVWLIKLLVTRAGVNRPPARGRALVLLAALTVVILAGVAPKALSGGVLEATWRSVSSYAMGTPFAGSTAADDQLRAYTEDRLLDGWAESPLTGHGFGATLQDFSRDYEEPWRWELQYHGLLFQTGLIGALVLVAGALMTLNAVIRAARARPDLTPSLLVVCTAAVAMLIGNATNPYLQAPGHVWSIFLPVALANLMLLNPHTPPAESADGPRPSRRERVAPGSAPAMDDRQA
jgi:hypothetical protein